jgi:hypothetical protein
MYMQYGCGWSAPTAWENFDASPTLRFERIPVLGRLYTKNARRLPENIRYGDIVRGLPIPAKSCNGKNLLSFSQQVTPLSNRFIRAGIPSRPCTSCPRHCAPRHGAGTPSRHHANPAGPSPTRRNRTRSPQFTSVHLRQRKIRRVEGALARIQTANRPPWAAATARRRKPPHRHARCSDSQIPPGTAWGPLSRSRRSQEQGTPTGRRQGLRSNRWNPPALPCFAPRALRSMQ